MSEHDHHMPADDADLLVDATDDVVGGAASVPKQPHVDITTQPGGNPLVSGLLDGVADC